MKSVHKALRLSHHKHTGKFIHHKHTSYGALVWLMMVPILVLSLVGQLAYADTLDVSAVVPQEPPPFAPSITYPANGSRLTPGTINVSGDCPLANPAIIIAIYEGTNIVGSTTCNNANGKFSVPVTFSYGTHTIYAQVVTFTGQLGLASGQVTFTRYFTVASNIGSDPKSIESSKLKLANPLILINGQGVIPFGPNMDAVWRGTISGGTLPYKVQIDWGDGKKSAYTIYDQSQQAFGHGYENPGYYTVIITVTDSAGNTSTLRVVAASALPAVAPVAADVSKQPEWYQRFLTSDIVKAYGILFIAIITIWFFKRRHDKDEEKQTPRHPYRHAHV